MALFVLMVFIWVFLTGELTWGNVGFGFLLSLFLLYISSRQMDYRIFPSTSRFNIFKYLLTVFRFTGFFFVELIKAGSTVFVSILKPSILRPGIIAVPLDLERDEEITLLANLITLTPGTLTLDVSTDKKVIYVHTIQVDDPDVFRKSIKDGFEKRVMEVMNP